LLCIGSHFVVLLKSNLDVQQTHLCTGLLNKSSCLAPALGVTKFIIVKVMGSAIFCKHFKTALYKLLLKLSKMHCSLI
jgi:hypothetical protein